MDQSGVEETQEVDQTVVINEKIQRCQDFQNNQDNKYGNIPLCYTENSPKEELVLEHVIQYAKQFALIYDENRALFLYPKNECEVYKFICTTIRPTKLGFLELYDYKTCAKYLSEYISYECLDPPYSFPKYIPSPANVLHWQHGDCFDMSIVLCSLLIGVGYDAYCVYGLAPREITTKNEGLMKCPFEDKGKLVEEVVESNEYENFSKTNQLAINKKQDVYSKFDATIKKNKEELQEQERKEAMNINDDEPDDLCEDKFTGMRLHCWVMIKAGKRGIKEDLFLESSTSREYPINQSPYEKIEAVFNNYNFWINLKPDAEIHDINLDQMSTSADWEYVMLDTLKLDDNQNNSDDKDEEELYQNGDENNAKQDNDDQTKELGELDMPPSWVPKLQLDSEKFFKGTPLGEQTLFFYKCRVDNYAPYSQNDGLIQRISLYDDFRRLKPKEIRYFYDHRSDKLIVKRRFPFEFKTIEEYAPGRAPHWKQVTEVDRRLRIIKFYPNRNQDGLILREEKIGEKTIEHYNNRDDRVIYRSVRFDPKRTPTSYGFLDNHLGTVVVTKMTQKFALNPNILPDEQIAKQIFDQVKQKVFVQYHLNGGDISPAVKVFLREIIVGYGKLNETGAEKSAEDPLIQKENQNQYTMEKECFQQIKLQESQSADEEKNQREEKIVLEKTLHDKAREKFKQYDEAQSQDAARDSSKDDYLYPFLEKAGLIDKQISKGEALEIKSEVMGKLRERLLSRADIIQKRLEEERQTLERQQTLIQKKGEHLSKEEEKNFEDIINQLHFKIEILEQRASRFEIMAFQKYEEMDKKLNEDKRLASVLH